MSGFLRVLRVFMMNGRPLRVKGKYAAFRVSAATQAKRRAKALEGEEPVEDLMGVVEGVEGENTQLLFMDENGGQMVVDVEADGFHRYPERTALIQVAVSWEPPQNRRKSSTRWMSWPGASGPAATTWWTRKSGRCGR